MQTKVCSHCGRELPAEAFNKSSKSSTGLQSWCKECQKKAYESRPKYPLARLAKYSDDSLRAELERRGRMLLLDPTPRDLMTALATMGYKGKLEYTETHVIDINNF